MKNIRVLICAALLCVNGWVHGAAFTTKVIAVLDGDTVLVVRDSHPVKLRLAEVDAPEKSQPYGVASQQALSDMVMGKQIQVESRAVDDYGRIIAAVSLEGINVNYAQVQRGMAWEYTRFHSNRELMALQREAQQAKRGLWAGADAIEPRLWRKQHPGDNTLRRAATPNPGCSKKRCAEMSSCAEAQQFFSLCGVKTLDADGDGIPCEKLCTPQAIKN